MTFYRPSERGQCPGEFAIFEFNPPARQKLSRPLFKALREPDGYFRVRAWDGFEPLQNESVEHLFCSQ